VNLRFCKPGVLKPDVLKPGVLKPDVLKPDVLWVYLEAEEVSLHDLSAGAYTTTWLVMVTLSPPVDVSKQDF
jgi:hypothetical protein